jgi:lipid II:glycine glycyltransferase (peptidoglycan interpeptide bridge formation enzyme)
MGIRVSIPEGETGSPSSFLQSRFWGDFKAEFGWKPIRLQVERDSDRRPLLLLIRRLPAGLCFAYVPHGPEIDSGAGGRAALLAALSECVKPFLPANCLFIRFDPPWCSLEAIAEREEEGAVRRDIEGLRPCIGKPLMRAAADVQPPDTVLVDLRRPEAEILAAMKSKCRYNIRLAGKKGVAVEEAGLDSVPVFYELYRETSERDRIVLHPELYYRRLIALAAERRASGELGAPDARLWIARHEGHALAAIITLFFGGQAVYLYGASSDEKRNLMPAYALQWAAIRAAKAAGCSSYDLFGIPPTDDPSHPMAGLYRFKTGFGGEIAHRAGSWDYPLSGDPLSGSLSGSLHRAEYSLFRAAERARAWWFKDFKKRYKRPNRA